MCNDQLTPFAKRKQDFSDAESLEAAAKIVWDHTSGDDESAGKDQRAVESGMYQH